jgi:hypothetical protein
MTTINELKWSSLTGVVNEMKSPNQFLKRLLFGNVETKSTEDIEISVLTKSREIAPFVRKNGEGIMVPGAGKTFQTVQAPNIRIKRPFTPSQLLYGRQPGTAIFPTAGEQISAIQQHINRDLQVMADMVTNTQEYMAAMVLQGALTYEVEDEEVYQITYPKPASHTITLSTFWDDSTPTDVEFNENLHTAKKLCSEEVSLSVSDCVLGTEAGNAFRALVRKGVLKTLDQRAVNGGNADFTQQFNDDGAIYLGSLDGIRFWEYVRTVSVNGVSTPMIRPKYAEFLCVTPAAENVEYYGAIPDMDAFQGGLMQTQRFSKSWMEKDPSAMIALLHSRPLPVPRRPGSMVSMKVVSG